MLSIFLLMFHTSLFQYSNISKYAENFRKSNFMLIHGTGDGMSTVPKHYFNTPIQYTVNFTSVEMMAIYSMFLISASSDQELVQ